MIKKNIRFIFEKKSYPFSGSFLAPPQGLEPWTYGLTVRRSNQLSYGGINMLFFKSDGKGKYFPFIIQNIFKIFFFFYKIFFISVF